eukprot:3973705-Lingulodinium_polyedra.AAC.1
MYVCVRLRPPCPNAQVLSGPSARRTFCWPRGKPAVIVCSLGFRQGGVRRGCMRVEILVGVFVFPG